MADIPKQPSPKALAKRYMLGLMARADYESKTGGVYRAMQIADNKKSDMAAMQALQYLSKLAELERSDEPETNYDVIIMPIESRDGKVVPIKSA